jgi:hypothetical protein
MGWWLNKSVSKYEVGAANIHTEFASSENSFLTLHDSRAFEPLDTTAIDIVISFIKERRKEGISLQDQLHAVW